MDEEHFEALKKAKADNYNLIYKNDKVQFEIDTVIKPMMQEVYEKLYDDLIKNNKKSPIFTHHINYISRIFYEREMPYTDTDPNLIVTDYIASMTDDYFIDLYAFLFPESQKRIIYTGYFD